LRRNQRESFESAIAIPLVGGVAIDPDYAFPALTKQNHATRKEGEHR
jgi:hypothetical protein